MKNINITCVAKYNKIKELLTNCVKEYIDIMNEYLDLIYIDAYETNAFKDVNYYVITENLWTIK